MTGWIVLGVLALGWLAFRKPDPSAPNAAPGGLLDQPKTTKAKEQQYTNR